MIEFAFDRHGHLTRGGCESRFVGSFVRWLVGSFVCFVHGTSKQKRYAFETFNRLVNRDVPQHVRFVDRASSQVVYAIKYVIDQIVLLFVSQHLGQVFVGHKFVFERDIRN